MGTRTRVSALALISEYELHDYLDEDDPRVDLSALENAFYLNFADMADHDVAGVVVNPTTGTVRPGNPAYITIHEGLDKSTVRLVYAHEVGHSVLGHEGTLRLSEMDNWFSDRAEREAWQVAAQLLIPHQVLWLSGQQGWSLNQVAALCDVPVWLVEMYPR